MNTTAVTTTAAVDADADAEVAICACHLYDADMLTAPRRPEAGRSNWRLGYGMYS